MEKRILITGGAGFIGSHLCEALISKGHSIVIYDNFNNYYSPLIKRNNVEEIKMNMKSRVLDEKRLEVIEGDICDLVKLEKTFAEEGIDIVIHLAAMAGVRYSIENPMLYTNVNINGTLNILEMCKRYNIKKLIFASSSSVYGNNKKIPFCETHNVDLPISPYAATKKSGELLCHTYHNLYGIDCACLRFFTVYGPRQRPDLAIHKFAHLIYNNKPIAFYGDGSTQRDYTYVEDIADGIINVLEWISVNQGVYEIINLGESRTISLSYMIAILEKLINKKAILDRLPMQPGEVNVTFANIMKAKALVGYEPKTDFEDGMKKFINWYLSNNNKNL